MSGIAGFLGRRQPTPEAIQAIFTSLAARGPDARGAVGFDANWQRNDNHGAPNRLLHTRLAIRDLSSAGNQPMGSTDGQAWLVYNGEIYGWEQHAAKLAAAGHPLRGQSGYSFASGFGFLVAALLATALACV